MLFFLQRCGHLGLRKQRRMIKGLIVARGDQVASKINFALVFNILLRLIVVLRLIPLSIVSKSKSYL